jgi:hypothetical protein
MKRAHTLAIVLATVLTGTTAYAERSSIDDVQAPRSQSVQAASHSTDDVEAPRGQSVEAPRDRTDDVEAPRSQQAQ